MKAAILEYLACPDCGADLNLASNCISNDNEITTGSLDCPTCQLSFPIERGIPRFVRSEWSGDTDIHTGARFGDSWKRYSRLHKKYTKQYFDWMAPVHEEFTRGKVVLDAGCGKGRHTAVLSACGAQAVIGVDIGSAIDVAYSNTGHLPNVHIVQADLKRLPFKRCFDWIASTGVIHHMEKPEIGFGALRTRLKPDGALSVWVYGRENNGWIIHFINPIRQLVTSRMPGHLLHLISLAAAVLVLLVARLIVYPWAQLQKRCPWLPSLFYQDYLAYIADFDLTEIDHIVFDHLTAPVAHYLPRETVESWYRAEGFPQAIIRWHNRNSWSAFGSFNGAEYQEVIQLWQQQNTSENQSSLQAMRLSTEPST